MINPMLTKILLSIVALIAITLSQTLLAKTAGETPAMLIGTFLMGLVIPAPGAGGSRLGVLLPIGVGVAFGLTTLASGCAGEPLPAVQHARVAADRAADALGVVHTFIVAACVLPEAPPEPQCSQAKAAYDEVTAWHDATQAALQAAGAR